MHSLMFCTRSLAELAAEWVAPVFWRRLGCRKRHRVRENKSTTTSATTSSTHFSHFLLKRFVLSDQTARFGRPTPLPVPKKKGGVETGPTISSRGARPWSLSFRSVFVSVSVFVVSPLGMRLAVFFTGCVRRQTRMPPRSLPQWFVLRLLLDCYRLKAHSPVRTEALSINRTKR